MFSLDASTAQARQWRPLIPSTPHISQIFPRRGNVFLSMTNSCPLPSLRRRCVRRVGRVGSFFDASTELHRASATHSATGATARAQVGAVSDSFSVSEDMSLAFPLGCSKNHSRLRG